MCRTPLATLALLAAVTLPASAGTTWIVDAAGGGDFTTYSKPLSRNTQSRTSGEVSSRYIA